MVVRVLEDVGEMCPDPWEYMARRTGYYALYSVDPNNPTDAVRIGSECKLLPEPRVATPRETFREEVRRRVQVPDPILGVWPGNEGVTGVGTKLWAEVGPFRPEPLTHNGKSVRVEADPVRFRWSTGDQGTAAPRSSYETSSPGSREDPAVRHVYETKSSTATGDRDGVYTISLSVQWQGRYRVEGIADPCNDWCDLGLFETSASRPYRVVEIVSVLVG